MGGFGSGRRTSRVTADDCVRINLSDLKRLGMLMRHCMHRRERVWARSGQRVAQLTLVADLQCLEPSPCLKITGNAFGQQIDCILWLESAAMHFGGERWYALCPHSGIRCTTLVLPPGKGHFASVRGWNVAYGSQRECEVHRAYRAIDKASSRFAALSKYSRRPIRERLKARVQSRHAIIDHEIDRLTDMIRWADRSGVTCPRNSGPF